MEKQHCDQCDNRCPIDALQCGKGRRHFGLESGEQGRERSGRERSGRETPAGALGLLTQCGSLLRRGGAQADLSALNPGEQAELERLLTVLLEDWSKKAPAKAHGRRHSHHRE